MSIGLPAAAVAVVSASFIAAQIDFISISLLVFCTLLLFSDASIYLLMSVKCGQENKKSFGKTKRDESIRFTDLFLSFD